jgi:ClpP class serine protease
MSNGLIDEIGYWDDAVEYTKRMLGVKNIKIVSYRRHRGFGSIFSGVNLNGLPGVFQSSTPRLMSVWSPGI